MGIVFKNNAKTTLGSSLNNSATSATVTDGSVFPSLGAGEFFFCTFDDGTNHEIVKVTGRSSNTLTIVRAQESTTARAFSSGDAAELRLTAAVLETIQENIAAKSANQTVYNATTASSATTYNIGIDPGVEANAMVFLNGVLQHHNTISFSGSTLTFDAAPPDGMALEVIVDNLINLQSSNLTVDSFTAADVGGSPQTAFTLSDTPAAETNLIVFVDGVFQDQDAYTISTNTLTITTGVIAGRGVTVYIINPVNIGTPSDGTVTSAKLSGNITTPGTLTVGSHDVAFDSPTFVVDNSNSRVGLGTASPSVPVDIVGDVKMSANLTVDTTTLVVDSSNNRVGIGTASPASKLTLSDTSSNSIVQTRFINDARNYALGVHGGLSDSFVLYDETAGATRLVVDTSGNVGIGDASPATYGKLVIAGSTPFTVIRSTDTTTAGLSMLVNSGSNGVGSIATDNGGHLTFDTGSTGAGQAERLRIDSSGKVKIGNTGGSGILNVDNGSNDGGYVHFANNVGSTTLTNDKGLAFGWNKSNGGGESVIIANQGAGSTGGLVFATNTSGGSYAERTRITSGGKLAINTTGLNNSFVSTGIDIEAGTSPAITMNRNSDGDIITFKKDNGTGTVGGISITSTATSFNTSSDARLKDVTGEARGLEVINELNPVSYNWKADGKSDEGLIAQEVMEIVPNAVSGSEEDMYQMDYSKLVTPLIKAIQEQQEQIETLKAEVKELKDNG